MAKAQNPADIPILIDAARSAVEELEKLLGKIYCISSAGQAFIGEDGGTEHGLFCVIEDMTCNTTLVHHAHRVLDDLASAIKGVSHG